MQPSVLAVNNYAHVRGGSDRCFLDLVALLAARGHRVRALATRPPNGASPLALPAEDVRLLEPVVLERPGLADLWRFHWSRAARRAVEGWLSGADRPELAHLHITYGQITSSILAPLRRAGIPVVQTLHEYRLACPVSTFVSGGAICEACRPRRFWRALPRRCNRGSFARTLVSVSESTLARALGAAEIDLFLTPSEFLRGKMIAHGIPAERLLTLPNFVDAERLAPARGPGEHFLYAGRLERLKGLFTLLDAAAEVRELPLYLAGDGEARAELEARVRAEGLGHVHFVGHQDADSLAALVAGARAVIVPSEWYENLPLAVLEAMARARAVIGTRIGGIPELVTEGETGWLVEPGDAAGLAECLRRAARDGAECERLGRRARARVEEEFSPAVHYPRLLAAYRRVLA